MCTEPVIWEAITIFYGARQYKVKLQKQQALMMNLYLEDLLYKLFDALLVVDSTDHLDTDLWYLGEVWTLKANVLQDLDDSFPYTYTSILTEVEAKYRWVYTSHSLIGYTILNTGSTCSLLSLQYSTKPRVIKIALSKSISSNI